MARTGRPKTELVLVGDEREQLLRWARRPRSARASALRSRIVLACAEGADNKAVAAEIGCAAATAGKCRRRFAYVTTDLLERSDHRSAQALEADIRAWIKAWNQNPKPFIWTKTADQILESRGRLIKRTSGAGH